MALRRLAPALALAAALLALLLTGPRPEAPFSGDNGVRLWQAASMSAPGAGLVRPMPPGYEAREMAPALTIPEGDELAPSCPPLFPLLTGLPWGGAPMGGRLSTLLLTLLCLPLLSLLAGGTYRGLLAFAASGLVPYSLVYWEHGPSAALVLASFLLMLRQAELREPLPLWLLTAVPAVLLRPESAAALFASAVAVALSTGGRGSRMVLAWAAASTAAAAVLLAAGAVPSRHLGGNIPLTGRGDYWSRARILASWVAPLLNLPLWGGLLLMVSAASARLGRLGRVSRHLSRALAAAALAGAAFPLYYVLRGSAGAMSLLTMCPALLLLLPLHPGRAGPRERAALLAGGLGMALVTLTAPTDGMFQFGPRFLLAPAVLLCAGLVRGVLRGLSGLRPAPRAAVAGALAALALLGASRGVLFQRFYRERHAELSRTLANLPEVAVLATTKPWLPLVAWDVTASRPFLCVREPERLRELAAGMQLVVVTSRPTGLGEAGRPGYRGLVLESNMEGLNLPVLPGESEPAILAI